MTQVINTMNDSDAVAQQYDFAVSDLRQSPEFFDTVVNRVWNEWWKQRGHSIEYATDRLHSCLNDELLPFALVAHTGRMFMGSALVIVSAAIVDRPQYTPWVAAVWVDPEYRNHGVGSSLVNSSVRCSSAADIKQIYLAATRERCCFYQRLGWTTIEENLGDNLLSIMTRDTANQ
jgi:N-acetylglutamate synthase-like GNAT family acetyltransferase